MSPSLGTWRLTELAGSRKSRLIRSATLPRSQRMISFTIQILASLTTYIEINVKQKGKRKVEQLAQLEGIARVAGERVYLPSRVVRFSQLFLTRGR